MSEKGKTGSLKYGVTVGICALFTALYVFGKEPKTLGVQELMRVLCDGFTLPGILCLCGGGIVAVSNEGALDGIGYAVRYAVKMLIPGMGSRQKRYADFVAERREKRVRGYGFLFVVGLIWMALAALFLVLFYHV